MSLFVYRPVKKLLSAPLNKIITFFEIFMLAAFLCLNIYLKLSWRSSQYVFGCIIPQWSTRLHCFHKSKCRANGAIMLQFILHFWAHCPSLREMCLVLRCQLNICVVLEIKMLFNHVRWYNLLILMMSDLASWQCLKTVAWLHDLSAFKDSHTHTHTHQDKKTQWIHVHLDCINLMQLAQEPLPDYKNLYSQKWK